MACDSSLVFELDLFVLGRVDGYELEVDEGSNCISGDGLNACSLRTYFSGWSSVDISMKSWNSPSRSVSKETFILMARPAATGPCMS